LPLLLYLESLKQILVNIQRSVEYAQYVDVFVGLHQIRYSVMTVEKNAYFSFAVKRILVSYFGKFPEYLRLIMYSLDHSAGC